MSATTNATVFASVASLLRKAVTELRTVKQSESNGLWGTVLGDLERIIGLCQQTEKPTNKAPVQQSPAAAAVVDTAAVIVSALSGSLTDRTSALDAVVSANPSFANRPEVKNVNRSCGKSLKRALETCQKLLATDSKPAAVKPESKPAAETVKAAAAKDASTEAAKHAAPKAASCPTSKADGSPCKGKVTSTGYCAAHSKNAKPESKPESAAAPKADSKPTAAEKPESAAPYKAGTVLIADGKGGLREATEADLWAALERLNGKKAA